MKVDVIFVSVARNSRDLSSLELIKPCLTYIYMFHLNNKVFSLLLHAGMLIDWIEFYAVSTIF